MIRKRQLLTTVSHLALFAATRTQAPRPVEARIPAEDGGEVIMNLRRFAATTPEQRLANQIENDRRAAETAQLKRELFANIVRIGQVTTPLMHTHPRTKRIEKFKEMTADAES